MPDGHTAGSFVLRQSCSDVHLSFGHPPCALSLGLPTFGSPDSGWLRGRLSFDPHLRPGQHSQEEANDPSHLTFRLLYWFYPATYYIKYDLNLTLMKQLKKLYVVGPWLTIITGTTTCWWECQVECDSSVAQTLFYHSFPGKNTIISPNLQQLCSLDIYLILWMAGRCEESGIHDSTYNMLWIGNALLKCKNINRNDFHLWDYRIVERQTWKSLFYNGLCVIMWVSLMCNGMVDRMPEGGTIWQVQRDGLYL